VGGLGRGADGWANAMGGSVDQLGRGRSLGRLGRGVAQLDMGIRVSVGRGVVGTRAREWLR
jgi:hypothetical protein